ncbi:MAG: ATPase [Lachnospiraceae bacterium]|nr:ATPase [Lachnospiraceae bacterium]
MAANRIEQLIDNIYDYVESCKASTFAPSKVTVNKDELYDLLDELKERTPDEIKRYQKIIANRDAIIADAEDKAEKIIEEAKAKAKQLVSEHEIMQQAYARVNEMVADAGRDADEMVAKAKNEADQLTSGALNYANNIMYDMEKILSEAYESTRERAENLINTLRENYEAVAENRLQIYNQINPDYLTDEFGDSGNQGAAPVQKDEPEYNDEPADDDYDDYPEDDEDYDFDEDKFFEHIDD